MQRSLLLLLFFIYSLAALAQRESASAARWRPGPIHSCYIRMRDGALIAVDVVLPRGGAAGRKFPAVLEMTRYWRSAAGDSLSANEHNFASRGYAVVTGDVRGTGASSGVWPYHRSRAETLDFGEVIGWIARQPWSDGRVVGYGVSYSANTADWMAERENPALKAIVPRFADYDPYADLYFPGGVPNRWMAQTWGTAVRLMDLNQKQGPGGKPLPGVRPVDADAGGQLLHRAIEQRRNVPSVWEGLRRVTFRDDRPPTWHGASMDDWGIYSVKQRVEAGGTPIQTWASWFDSGTANGVLHRFMSQSNPQRAYIGAWTHGGFHGANPFQPLGTPPDPSVAAQLDSDRQFMHRFAGKCKPLKPRKLLSYYTLNDGWKTTTVWPLPQARPVAWYFGPGQVLAQKKPGPGGKPDQYAVDFTATTGNTNRWHTNGGVEVVWYGNRAAGDRKLLTYTSAPLTHDTEITGEPVADLYIATDRDDAAYFIYLEDVAPDGTVTYLSEGELRAIDRKVTTAAPVYHITGPCHSFRRADALPVKPHELERIQLSMMPVSVRIHAGHRIRIALAGADADTFARIPATGGARYTVYHNGAYASGVVLPVVGR